MRYTVRQNTDGIYYIYRYVPQRYRLLGMKGDSPVYRFKMFGHLFHDFKTIVKTLKKLFRCEISVGIPDAGIGENNIQRICDRNVLLIPKYKRHSRQYARTKGLFIANEKDRINIIADQKKYSRILLVDDITTQGKTFEIYNRMLKDYFKSVEIVKFAFGSKKTGNKKYILTVKPRDKQNISIEVSKIINEKNIFQKRR